MPNYKCFQWCNEVVYANKWGDVEKVFCKKCRGDRTMQKTTEDITLRPSFKRPKRVKVKRKWGGNTLWKSLA